MARELETEPTLRDYALLARPRKWWVAGSAVTGLGISLVVAMTGAVYIGVLNNLHTNSVGTISAWVAALALVVAALVALAHKGRHAGWFHPLSLPFATLAIMSLGAAL